MSLNVYYCKLIRCAIKIFHILTYLFCLLDLLVPVTGMLKVSLGASLVALWLRICLLMQGTRVRALVWEDPTCRGAAGPVSHNY